MKVLIVAVVTFVGISVAKTSHAFKADIHKAFTASVAAAYLECAAKAGESEATPNQLESLARGTWAEDETQLIRRTKNWHYLHQKSMPKKAWQPPFPYMSHPSLDRIFDRRLGELASSKQSDDIFLAAGRVTHFLQDMRVPAHVLAVHHGSVLGTDGFDKRPIHKIQMSISKSDCVSLAAAAKSPDAEVVRKRLCQAAKETKDRIQQKIKGTQCSWLQVFWCEPGDTACGEPPYPGFGMYRGGAGDFGSLARFTCGNEMHGLEQADYANFAEPGYSAMVRDTVFMMFLAQKRATGAPMAYESRKEGESTCP